MPHSTSRYGLEHMLFPVADTPRLVCIMVQENHLSDTGVKLGASRCNIWNAQHFITSVCQDFYNDGLALSISLTPTTKGLKLTTSWNFAFSFSQSIALRYQYLICSQNDPRRHHYHSKILVIPSRTNASPNAFSVFRFGGLIILAPPQGRLTFSNIAMLKAEISPVLRRVTRMGSRNGHDAIQDPV